MNCLLLWKVTAISKGSQLVDRLMYLQNKTSMQDLKYSMTNVINIIGNSLNVSFKK